MGARARVSNDPGSVQQQRVRHQEWADELPMTVRCGLCTWTFEGNAGECRTQQFEHRQTHANGKAKAPVKHLSQGLTANDRREAVTKMAQPTRWTREKVIERMQEWARVHGRPPTSTDWKSPGPEWPTQATVANVFGRWSVGITAAGLASVPNAGAAANVLPADTTSDSEPSFEEPKPEAVPDPATPAVAEPTNGHAKLSLTQLAQAVEQANADVDEAIDRKNDAIANLQAALEAA